MGLPKVIFATARSDDSNTANSYGLIRYGEIYNDKVPQVGRYGTDESIPANLRGEYQLDSFDIQRAVITENVYRAGGSGEPSWVKTGTTQNTWYGNYSVASPAAPAYVTTWTGTNPSSGSGWTTGTSGTGGTTTSGIRSTLGTFPLQGGGFEQMEFNTGTGSSSVEAQLSGAGVAHNYVAFVNTGGGTNTLHNGLGAVHATGPSSPAAHGPPTAHSPDAPWANIEFDVSHTASPLKAGAGGMGFVAFSTVGAAGGATSAQHTGDPNWYAYSMVFNPVSSGPSGQPSTPANAVFQPFYGSATAGPGDDIRRGPASTYTAYIWANATSPGTGPGGTGGSTANTRYWAFGQLSTAQGVSVTMIPEIWTPQRSYHSSSSVADAWEGAIEFKIMPDSEHTMTTNMVATTAGVSSMTISADAGGGPIATHSRITVTTDAVHNMTDSQNQVVIAGATNVTNVNGLWNVATVPSTTTFTYDVPYSTATSPTTITPNDDLTCVTFDGIDKTGAVVKSSGTVVAEIVHGGNAGNNKVILRGDVNLSGSHTIHSNSDSPSIATVNFSSRTYKSLFHEAGLELNETTGQVTSNGTFDGINDKGLKELDGYFPKYKNGRDYALNQVKTDGTISQAPIKAGADSDNVTFHGGAEELPSSVFFKSLTYANGFTANVLYATAFGNSSVLPSVAVEHIETVPGPDEGALGETYSLAYNDVQFPTPNTSSYWAMNRADNLRIIDPEDTANPPAILTYVSTTEMFNTAVHFTIRAMKKSSHGPTRSSTKTISGWGTYENGEHNYVDGRLFIRVYNNTDADRDSIMTIYGDANNADSATSDDFNRNETAKKIDDVAVTNEEFLQNNYSNGNYTVIDSA